MSDILQCVRFREAAPQGTVSSAVPFLRGGAAELGRHVGTGKLKPLSLRGGEQLFFQVQPLHDDWSGLGLHLSLAPKKAVSEITLELRVYERNTATPLRTVVKTVRPLSGPHVDPFLFEPISGSSGVSYQVVFSLVQQIRKASVLCLNAPGSLTITGDRAYEGLRPLAIPYYPLTGDEAAADEPAPRVSVLIVTYNSEQYVEACLRSVLGQGYPNLEVLVVDNNSRDRTMEIVREFHPHVTLLPLGENLGYCKANNLGLNHCTGEFICVLNPDTVLEPGTIAHLVKEISLSPQVAVVGCRIDTRGSMTRYADAFLVGPLIGTREQFLNDGRRFMAAPCGTGFLIRREVIRNLGYLFDERFVSDWEDHDLGLRCWSHGYVCLHTPFLGIFHVGGGSFGPKNRRREARIARNSLLTYFKNYDTVTFLKAMLGTIRRCRSAMRLLGVAWFLAGFWKYLPEHRSLPRDRGLGSEHLKLIACGVRAVAGRDPLRQVPQKTESIPGRHVA